MRLLIVLGTRPEAIKLAPVARALRNRPGTEVHVVFTGQHETMVNQVADFFDLHADTNLRIMTPGQTLAQVAARTLDSLAPLIVRFSPDWVVVQGDTTSALAAALAAFYGQVKLAHVEAGLRSGDMTSPWPEEGNRALIARVASLHLAPTASAADALAREGIAAARIHVVGNTVVDALFFGLERIRNEAVELTIKRSLPPLDLNRKLVLVTGHRRESFGEPFREICRAIRDLAETEDVEIVYPVHLNPNVQNTVRSMLDGAAHIHLLPPVEYPVLLWLLQHCHFVLTDSGGIQEEAPSVGKPVVVMRDVTERMEGVHAGVSVIAGTASDRILFEARGLLHDPRKYEHMSRKVNLYGDGYTAERIADLLTGYGIAY